MIKKKKIQTVTACKKKEISPPFYFIILLNVRVRFDTTEKMWKYFRGKEKESHPFHKQLKVLFDSHLDFAHKIFPAFSDALPFSELQKFCGTAMPYCKIFIWFFLLFFTFFSPIIYVTVFRCTWKIEQTRYELTPFKIQLNSPWLHHLTSSQIFPTAFTSVCCAWCFKSIPFNIN